MEGERSIIAVSIANFGRLKSEITYVTMLKRPPPIKWKKNEHGSILRHQDIYSLDKECKVELWLGSYISRCICLIELNVSLIIILDILPLPQHITLTT